MVVSWWSNSSIFKHCLTLRNFLTNLLCMLPIAMARSSSGRVTKPQGEGAVLGAFFPINNALHSIAFGIHTKMTEPINMPFWMNTRLGPRNHALDGGAYRLWGKGNFRGLFGH